MMHSWILYCAQNLLFNMLLMKTAEEIVLTSNVIIKTDASLIIRIDSLFIPFMLEKYIYMMSICIFFHWISFNYNFFMK